MIRGWTSSNSTNRQARRLFEAIADSEVQVKRSGRHASAEATAQDSFYTRPHDVAKLSSFDGGVAGALRSHLAEQSLTELADQVPNLTRLGRRLNKVDKPSDTVSELVYEMH